MGAGINRKVGIKVGIYLPSSYLMLIRFRIFGLKIAYIYIRSLKKNVKLDSVISSIYRHFLTPIIGPLLLSS